MITPVELKVCVICSSQAEFQGFNKALETAGGEVKKVNTHSTRRPSEPRSFYQCYLQDHKSRKICYEVFNLSDELGQSQYTILNKRKYSWLFMTGTCAGNPDEVQLADLIVADYTFFSKRTENMDESVKWDVGERIALPSHLIYIVNFFLQNLDRVMLKVSTDRPVKSLRFRMQEFLHYLYKNKTAQWKDVKDIFDSSKKNVRLCNKATFKTLG